MVLPSHILIPLYLDPRSTPWTTLYNNLRSYPSVQFDIIVDPNNGPGPYPPSSSYISSISKLQSYQNAHLLGYVHTTYASRSLSDTVADIASYASWGNYRRANIKMDGIFFDEAPWNFTDASYAYMSSIATVARSKHFWPIIFNPGVIPDSKYYALADQIVVWENNYKIYNTSFLDLIPDVYRGNSSLIVHDFTGNQTDQAGLVKDVVSRGLGGLYVTTSGGYSTWSGSWSQFLLSFKQALAA